MKKMISYKLKHKKLKYFWVCIIMIISQSLFADIGQFDIVSIIIDEKQYYIRIEARGDLKNNDLCYYDNKGEYSHEVSDMVESYFKLRKEVELFGSYEVLNLEKIEDFKWGLKLYLMKEKTLIKGSKVGTNFEIKSVIRGNTYGYIYSEKLTELDNHWLENYSIERLFRFDDDGMCSMGFYGIKGNTTFKEKEKMKEIVSKKYSTKEDFNEYLSELYSKNIFMIGLCSC